MKILLITLFCLVHFSTNANNVIIGTINENRGTIQVFTRNSPFDDTLTLITESSISSGKFELDFHLPYDSEIILSVNDLTVSRQIESESKWEIELEIIELPKSDFFGNTKRLEVRRVESTSDIEIKLLQIESDIEKIKAKNIKGNGRIGKNYLPELEEYLIDQITKSNSQEFKTKFCTSKTFAFALDDIKRAKDDRTSFESYFIDNFQVSFNGLSAIKILYAQSIQVDFLTKKLGKSNYFDFIKNRVSEIEDERIRQSTLAVLITSTIGRKWVNDEESKEELAAFIELCEYPELKKWLLAFQDYHSNTLVGSELKDFELESPQGGKISFSDFKGKYLLLDFWATWCGPCIKNMKKLPELKNQYSNLEVLCVTTEQDVEKVGRFIKRNGYNTSLHFGIARNNKEIDSYFNKRAIPLYFLVDPEGIVIDMAVSDPVLMINKHLEN